MTDFDGTLIDEVPCEDFIGPPTYDEWRMDMLDLANCWEQS